LSRPYRPGIQSSNEKSLLPLGLLANDFARRMRGSGDLAERKGFEMKIRSLAEYEGGLGVFGHFDGLMKNEMQPLLSPYNHTASFR
jgi:hypothetical protein